MSEAERRTGYNPERILIDASRILSPQFGAQGIFLSGAQVELLRNIAAYLGRDTTFVDEYHDCYYLRVTDGDFDDIQAIVADLEDKLLMVENTMWGYNDRLVDQVYEVADGSSPFDILLGAVPAGEVWIIENGTVYHNEGSDKAVQFFIYASGSTYYTSGQLPVPSGLYYGGGMNVTLKEGDQFAAKFYGLSNSTLARMRVAGYKMKVPE